MTTLKQQILAAKNQTIELRFLDLSSISSNINLALSSALAIFI